MKLHAYIIFTRRARRIERDPIEGPIAQQRFKRRHAARMENH